MKRIIPLLFSTLLLSACVTTSGNYVVTSAAADGTELKVRMYAQGSAIYSVRNAICANNPEATVFIHDAKTGEELKSESPYKCK